MNPLVPTACLILLQGLASRCGTFDEPRAQLQLVEQASQEGFPIERPFLDQGTQLLQAAGVYLRIRDGEKLYALCLYVDLPRLVAQTQGKERKPEALAQLLIKGKVAHAFVSRFVRPLPQANRMAFLLGNLKAYWPGEGFDPESPSLKNFRDFFDQPVATGAETQVWRDTKGNVYTREVGGRASKTHDAKLGEAFSSAYLGEPSMDAALKGDLLKELPIVMDMVEMMKRPVRAAKP